MQSAISLFFFLFSRILHASWIYRTKTSCRNVLSVHLLMCEHTFTSCSIKFLFNAPIALWCYLNIASVFISPLRERLYIHLCILLFAQNPIVYSHSFYLLYSGINFRDESRVDRNKFHLCLVTYVTRWIIKIFSLEVSYVRSYVIQFMRSLCKAESDDVSSWETICHSFSILYVFTFNITHYNF